MPSEVEGFPLSAGFSAQVNGASIADLVQMYCQTRTRAAVEVRSGLHIGYLFFDEGRIIHAELGSLVGEEAFALILSLSAGAFQPCLRPWPVQESIQCPVEALLLRAAQAIDEGRRRAPAANPDVPGPGVRVSMTRSVGVPRPEDVISNPAPAPAETAAREVAMPRRTTPIASGVRVDPTGALVSQRGGKAEGLADLIAFSAPLLNVIGNELGLGETKGADFYCAGDREILMRQEPDGSWVGAVGLAPELLELRKRIGGV